MKLPVLHCVIALPALLAAMPGLTADALTDADEIVRRANLAAYYAGDDGRSEARMTIRDAQGREQVRQFTVLRRDREDGGDQDFMVFFSRPSDVRGTVFLVTKHVDADDDRWLYLPGLDLVRRISAGDKRTSFVGSNYFYEDVSGRNPGADKHSLVETGAQQYVLRHEPLDAAGVEFAAYLTYIDRDTFLPMKIDYLDARGEIFRRVEVLSVANVQGHPTVTRSQVTDLATGGNTTMEFRYFAYDIGLPDSLFAERSMRQPPREWLARPNKAAESD